MPGAALAERPAPRAGEHTREILRELGYDAGRIDALLAAGTVREAQA
jgi:crotonobetainyl-CoA:carnitine CoA-transferase CaiB-like acyl-CoA transferase